MSSFVNPANGDDVTAENLLQILEDLQGLRNIPLSVTGINDASNYSLTLRNSGTGGRGFQVLNSSGSQIFAVTDSGIVVPAGAIGTAAIADGSITPAKLSATAGVNWPSTPTITQGGTTPSATITNQSYMQQGKRLQAHLTLTATSAGGAGNDIIISSLPVASRFSGGFVKVGEVTYSRAAGAGLHLGFAYAVTSTTIKFLVTAGTGGYLGNTNGPSFAVANGDQIDIDLDYEVA